MNKGNRPVSREKRVGTGKSEVKKRGSGLGGSTGGPVGNPGRYSDRMNPPSRSTSSGFNGYTRGSRYKTSGGRPKLLTFIVLLIAMYVIVTQFGGNDGNAPQTQDGTPSSQSINVSQILNGQTTYDNGAYEPSKIVSSRARPKYTNIIGNGQDKVTVMVYMCGTDLESRSGLATADINEMLRSRAGINIILETGGTLEWQNKKISSSTNQRYRVTSDGLELIQDKLGKKSMMKPETLTDFIQFCKKEYPANRYILILWDHGGGSLSGYGYDQHFRNDSMTLDEIATALKNAGCTFDFIGFDACLMATLETAMVLEPYADYMIASEEVEPGIGWYYTGWLDALSKNPSISTLDLGKILIDDYIAKVRSETPRSQGTLSLIDLAEMKGTIPKHFKAFAQSTGRLLDGERYQIVSDARYTAKEFSKASKINQIDVIDFSEKLGTSEARAFATVLRSCVKYNRTTPNITNANGVSIYFPYNSLNKMSSMLNTYREIGMDEEYTDCIRSFASLAAGGQIVSGSSSSPLDSLLGTFSEDSGSIGSSAVEMLLDQFLGDFSSISGLTEIAADWLDIGRVRAAADYYSENRLDASMLKTTVKNGQKVLALTEKQWSLVQGLEMNVFIDDGEGFIDLGLDNVFEFNDDGDLIMEYDGTWMAINGQVVSYYMISEDRTDDHYLIKGRVPALLNGQRVDIHLAFDDENPYGTVLGAQICYDSETETETQAKGLIDILPGDRIDYLCDYYDYNGSYSDTYFLGEPYTATGEWYIENLSVGKVDARMTYRITDIYNNKYWVP